MQSGRIAEIGMLVKTRLLGEFKYIEKIRLGGSF